MFVVTLKKYLYFNCLVPTLTVSTPLSTHWPPPSNWVDSLIDGYLQFHKVVPPVMGMFVYNPHEIRILRYIYLFNSSFHQYLINGG